MADGPAQRSGGRFMTQNNRQRVRDHERGEGTLRSAMRRFRKAQN